MDGLGFSVHSVQPHTRTSTLLPLHPILVSKTLVPFLSLSVPSSNFCPFDLFQNSVLPDPDHLSHPPHSYLYSLFTLTVNLITPSWTYSSPLAALTSLRCSQ